MFPLIPLELLETEEELDAEKEKSSDSTIEQSKHNPTLVVVDEQPPKMQNIKPIMKSPVIDMFYNNLHVVGKIRLTKIIYLF